MSDLAKYLKKVAEDDELFASYFWWRDFYTINTHQQNYQKVCKQVRLSGKAKFKLQCKVYYRPFCAPGICMQVINLIIFSTLQA